MQRKPLGVVTWSIMWYCTAIPDDGIKQENMEQDDEDRNPDQRITRKCLFVP